MTWTFIWLMLIIKIPVGGMAWIIWWSIKKADQEPESAPDGGSDDGGSKLRNQRHRRPRTPRPYTPLRPRRGPHAGVAVDAAAHADRAGAGPQGRALAAGASGPFEAGEVRRRSRDLAWLIIDAQRRRRTGDLHEHTGEDRGGGQRGGGASDSLTVTDNRTGSTYEIPPGFLEGVEAGNERLTGFGHRVYRNYDPRARIIRKYLDDVFEVRGKSPLLDVATELKKRALDDDYFTSRKLYPNVDFYSGLIYEALGLPVAMFPVMFAIGRTSGWIAQWLEMVEDPERKKIARPRQIYTGDLDLDYVPLADRSEHQCRSVPAQPIAILAPARPASLDQCPEARRVVGHLEMADLVPDDVVEHALRREQQAPVEAHPPPGGARGPAGALRADREAAVGGPASAVARSRRGAISRTRGAAVERLSATRGSPSGTSRRSPCRCARLRPGCATSSSVRSR